MSTARYQEGSIARVRRAKGPDVWVYRWREVVDGKRLQKKKVIGDVDRYPNKSAVKREVENLRSEINARAERVGRLTVEELWGHFQANELRDPDVSRSPTTIALYLTNFRHHITPHWGKVLITEITPVGVERWLRSLPYANSTKSKLRNQLSALFSHAIRHGLYSAAANPIKTVRQSAERETTPDILSLEEIGAIISRLDSTRVRTAVLVAAVTGCRRSEVRGLKWRDVDFEKLWLRLERGKVQKHQTKLKTEGSRKGVPIPQELAAALITWRGESLYRSDEDWIFASEMNTGREPMWFDILLPRHIQPAAKAAGIDKAVGWHTFRRSLASILAKRGENVKVVQELLRHANSSTTMKLYQQAYADDKRAAQDHTRSLFLAHKRAS